MYNISINNGNNDSPETGYFYVINWSKQNFKRVNVTHRVYFSHAYRDTCASYENLNHMHSSGSEHPFPYSLGVFSHFNYWMIEVETHSGIKYDNGIDFSCGLRAGDNGFVYIAILPDLTVHLILADTKGCSDHLINPSFTKSR